jgi:hypothetical protein
LPPADATVAPASENPTGAPTTAADWFQAEPAQVNTAVCGGGAYDGQAVVAGWHGAVSVNDSVTSVACALRASPKRALVAALGMIAPRLRVHCPRAQVQVTMLACNGQHELMAVLSCRHGIEHTLGVHAPDPLELFPLLPASGQITSDCGAPAAPRGAPHSG